jgi:hypothetical protein
VRKGHRGGRVSTGLVDGICRGLISIVQSNDLIGQSVEFRVDQNESGDKGRLNKIVGTIYGGIRDQNGEILWIFASEVAQPTDDEEIGERQGMTYFLIHFRRLGDTLEWAFENNEDEIPVYIGYYPDKPIIGTENSEPSRTKYFSFGYLSFIRD